MTDLAALLEGTALAQHLRVSRWTYPVVNAGHILGIALLVGSALPMAVFYLRGYTAFAARLRPFAIAGLVLAFASGAALLSAQATEYVQNGWFLAKLAVIGLALLNATLALRQHARRNAVLSLLLWPLALFCGRMIGFS